ncbi:MAG: response regulator [Gemmataceae bacterium]
MLNIRRESIVVSNSGIHELLHPSENVVAVCRSGDAIALFADSKRLLRVLVVDDNPDNADSLSMLVNLWGYDARTAYGGAAALEMALALKPHVVLLDLSMPRMDGCQVARQLRQQTAFAHTLLIVVTGWTDQVHRLLCAEAGFDHYLIKPLDLALLELLLQSESSRLVQSAEQEVKANATGGDENDSRQEDLIPAAQVKTEVLACWS